MDSIEREVAFLKDQIATLEAREDHSVALDKLVADEELSDYELTLVSLSGMWRARVEKLSARKCPNCGVPIT